MRLFYWAAIVQMLMASRPIRHHLPIIEAFWSRRFTGFNDWATDFLLLPASAEAPTAACS